MVSQQTVDKALDMSSKEAIIVEDVWKQYALIHQGMQPRGQSFVSFVKRLANSAQRDRVFWALKSVSFRVQRGESVGIIGRNGSGKSTLLRILSGISEPTKGHVEVRGLHAELFSLNAGFNMDLTGRKNIFLYGAITGVDPSEIAKKLDDIVTFAELGKFIDQPVKRYSSGMRARLGFSIIVHILPEIMFIDEALSVGDAEFRLKCLDRIRLLSAKGHTLVFVSHSLGQVVDLCDRVIWLDEGRIVLDGPAREVIREYKVATNTLDVDDRD